MSVPPSSERKTEYPHSQHSCMSIWWEKSLECFPEWQCLKPHNEQTINDRIFSTTPSWKYKNGYKMEKYIMSIVFKYPLNSSEYSFFEWSSLKNRKISNQNIYRRKWGCLNLKPDIQSCNFNLKSQETNVDVGSLHRATLGVSIAREQVKWSGKSVSPVLILRIT